MLIFSIVIIFLLSHKFGFLDFNLYRHHEALQEYSWYLFFVFVVVQHMHTLVSRSYPFWLHTVNFAPLFRERPSLSEVFYIVFTIFNEKVSASLVRSFDS